jgi:myo-inositol-1(or 4)-monophosphatase
MELVNEAIVFAAKAHDGMRRKRNDTPYILHPMEAAVIVSTMTDDQAVIAAAVLHDVVEDAGVTMETIEEKFGTRVKELVACETENKRADRPPLETWKIRKEESLLVLRNTEDIDVMIVWLGDKLANMRSLYREWKIQGDDMWNHFNQKDTKEQAWYYYTIAELTNKLSDTPAWIEYKALTDIVFQKGNN